MNIDGEYYHIVKPLEVRVRSSHNYPDSRVRFLQKIG